MADMANKDTDFPKMHKQHHHKAMTVIPKSSENLKNFNEIICNHDCSDDHT